MNCQRPFLCALFTVTAIVLVSINPTVAGMLTISADTSDPAPRAAFEQVVEAFRAEHPDIDVRLTVYDHERFKPAIRLFLMFDAPGHEGKPFATLETPDAQLRLQPCFDLSEHLVDCDNILANLQLLARKILRCGNGCQTFGDF